MKNNIEQGNGALRKDGKVSGVIKCYGKREQASVTPLAMGWIKSIQDQGVVYTGSPQGLRGLILLFGALGSVLSLWIGVWRFIEELSNGSNLFLIFPFLFMAFGIWMLLWTIRLELFRPIDEPILFDRRHRKVYRIFRQTQHGIKGLFKRWPLHITEYDWDLIDAEHQAKLVTNGSTVTRYHVSLPSKNVSLS
jgi:hypothetical protein